MQELGALFNAGTISGLTDRQLLELFRSRRDEAAELAFAALMERHGPMVLRVCRGILNDPSDADDAFQATFLVLVQQKAGPLWVRDSLGPWLYGVACRIATRARADRSRRQRHECRAAESGRETETGDIWEECAWGDLNRLMHAEVNRLSANHRAAIVLCYLEGQTHEQAAQNLGWPVGTVRSRLARARDRLRDRLERRGVAPWDGFAAQQLSEPLPSVSRELFNATIQAVTRGPESAVAVFAQATLKALYFKKLAQTAAVMVMIGLAAAGSTVLVSRGNGGRRAAQTRAVGRAAAHSVKAQTHVDPTAMQLAERLLKVGSDLFDAKQSQALASTFTRDGAIQLIDVDEGKFHESETKGRTEVESFYESAFKNATTIDSENHVEFAQFVLPDLMVIHGRFRPDAGQPELPFVQIRIKEGEAWRIQKLSLFLASQEKRSRSRDFGWDEP
jgi:RNA polymerase sigma factor (sigma-70 family)